MKIKITFEKLYVTDNGDPSQETNGELYYSFKVNGKTLSNQAKNSPKDIKKGATITLDTSDELDISNKETVKVSGYAGDVDKGFNGKDEYDDFSVQLSFPNNWKQGNNTVHLEDGRLKLTLYYTVEVEGSTGTEDLITPVKTASVVIASFANGKFEQFFQNAQINYGTCFDGYDTCVLIKKTYSSSHKPDVHVKDIRTKKILGVLRDLADDGYSIDLRIYSHGSENKITLEDGEIITNDDINLLATGQYAGSRFPLRMVYQMNCQGSSLNNNFIYAGAKVVGGSRDINFMTNQSNKFTKSWNDGERFDTALLDSNTASSRTVMHAL